METLPPGSPVAFDPADAELVERATLALGRLDGLSLLVPDAKLHAWIAVRKEAVLSSHADGVGASVSTTALLAHEDAPASGPDGVAEVAALAAALDLGASRLRGGSTLSADLLREMHAVLRPDGTAPSDGVVELERFLRGPSPALLRVAVALARVEGLQLFGAESGRLGRALIPLLLYGEGVLQLPLLVASGYFRRHRDAGRRRIAILKASGDPQAWVRFALEGLATSAEESVVTIRSLLALFATDRESIAGSAELRVFEATKRHPVATVARLAEVTGLAPGAARDAVTALERLRILREREGDVFAYTAYCDVLDEGTVLRPQ